jgi:hypothetical protein
MTNWTTPQQKLAKYRQAIAYDVDMGLPNNTTIPKSYSNINWNSSPNRKKPPQTGEGSDAAGIVTQRTYQLHLKRLLAAPALVEARPRVRQ